MEDGPNLGSGEMEDGPFTVVEGRWRMHHLQWQGGDGGWTIYSGREEMEDAPFTMAWGRWKMNQVVAVGRSRMDHLQ